MCQTDTSIDNEFVIGFGKGDVIFLQEQGKSLLYGGGPPKKFTIYKQVDPNVPHEGQIISVAYSQKVFAWSTSIKIRVRYYPLKMDSKGTNICYIESPNKIEAGLSTLPMFP
jgi:hypothetical protein|tara:strand:- start:309 stop:644 length:336 start_codon:yes stop_codon:yes gene_type:complete